MRTGRNALNTPMSLRICPMPPDGSAILDQWIERLRKLGASDVGSRVALEAAPLVDEAVKATARAGTTPMGEPWKPTQAGTPPLARAADHITTKAQGPVVAVTLSGVDVIHHKGLGRQPRRQIIPDGVSVPPSVWSACHKAAANVFRAIVGGR
jgi:hypothetical protein